VKSLAIAAVVVLFSTSTAQAQLRGIERWAEQIIAAQQPRWVGPRVPYPPVSRRPSGTTVVARSFLAPLAVHASPDVDPERADAALLALEDAYRWLHDRGWPEPWPDGGAGGTIETDLYLVGPPDVDHAAGARVDAPVTWSYFDAATSFAVVDASVPDRAVAPCVASAYAQAALLGQDPAEAPAWRRATGAYVASLVTGAECTNAIEQQRDEPWRSWIDDAAGDGEGGALLLSMVGEREDRAGEPGSFARDVWQVARQRTWDGEGLRASPDVWMALAGMLEARGRKVKDLVEDIAVERWIDAPDAAPLVGVARQARLPARLAVSDPPIEPYGSGYALVDVSDPRARSSLRVWLRGEYGVEWSLVVVRLDASGRDKGRTSAPSRERDPRSYLPIDLDPGVARVLLVATNLSSRLPDADVSDENVRAFRFIVDR